MPRLRSDDVVVRSAAALALALVLSAPLVGSCGGSSRGGAGHATGGVGANNAGGAGTVTGGTHSAGGTSSADSTQTNSTSNEDGTSSEGGTQAGGAANASDAGSGGAPADGGGGGAAGAPIGHGDGWPCGDQRCSTGQACVRCLVQNQTPQLCVPSPDQDPTGYAIAIKVCDAPPFGRDDCDGPEDCAAGQYCVAREGTRCQAEPSTTSFCCFTCDNIADCTLCHVDQDCPDGETCEPNQAANSNGCRPVH
ncbi:MAG TPA: hypothetical protein VNG33_19455 [Polyangiaceae bacterium]|nr:hypothetical protein [Polyangiaceae bacterium]